MGHALVVAIAVLLTVAPSCVRCFYVPGVHPVEFKEGERVGVRVGRVASARAHIPYDYYDLPSCEPAEGVKDFAANLGEVLSADIFHNSPYELFMLRNETCKVACHHHLHSDRWDFQKLRSLAKTEPAYRVFMRIDNMPAIYAVQREGSEIVFGGRGYPLTEQYESPDSEKKYFLTNHVDIFVLYHELGAAVSTFDDPGYIFRSEPEYRIIRVYVRSRSIDYEKLQDPQGSQCYTDVDVDNRQEIRDDMVTFTYSVTWLPTDDRWASRWDGILESSPIDYQMNMFAVTNSLALTLMFSVAVAVLLIRAVKKDFSWYDELDMKLEDEEGIESDVFVNGWKVVAKDVFRSPMYPELLAIMKAAGDQLYVVVSSLTVISLFGIFSPSNRGALMTAAIIFFAMLSYVAGTSAARVYKLTNGTNRRTVVVGTAFAFPGVYFVTFLALDLMLWSLGSSGAVPFGTFATVSVLWFLIACPLTFLGAARGFRNPDVVFPCKTNAIPRQIPSRGWYLSTPMLCFSGGAMSFGVIFVQLFFIFTKLWLHEFVYMFGFIFASYVMWLIVSAEMAIVAVYITLCMEDYHWWWKSLLVPSSFGLFSFVGSCAYFIPIIPSFATGFVFVSYSLLASFTMALVAGSIGFEVCLLFVQKIYSSIKVD